LTPKNGLKNTDVTQGQLSAVEKCTVFRKESVHS